jgi:hypothetical protein
MKLHRLIAILAMLTLLGGCASSTPRMQEVRDLAAQSAKLGSYHEMTERFRTTYQRERPYLTPASDAGEHLLDARRQAACDDFVKLQYGVQAYMQALGALAGDDRYDLEDQVKSMGSGIKAWPDSGLDERHVNAYAGLSRLLSRVLTSSYQDRSVQALVRAGQQPMQDLLDAMRTLLRYYDKTNSNEQKIVLGMMEFEIPYVDTPKDRLLAMLAKVQQQNKTAEYRLINRRFTLAQKNLDAIILGHQTLLQHLDQLDSSAAKTALAQAGAEVRNSRAALGGNTAD